MNIEIKHLWLHKCPKKWNQYTLIALVITIIVLLILAGITIVTLTGDNGILTKVGDAKNKNTDAEIEEEIKLAWNKVYLDDAINNYTPEQKASALEAELERNKSGETATVSANGSKLNVNYRGKDKVLDISTGTVKELSAIAKAISDGTVFNDDNTPMTDEYENTFIIPKGFKLSKDSAEVVTEGIVIEDATYTNTKGSEFVWIPVSKDNKKIVGPAYSGTDRIVKKEVTINLSRYIFNGDGSIASVKVDGSALTVRMPWGSLFEFVEEDSRDTGNKNAVAKDINSKNGFIAKTNAAEGFWIGRYEARTTSPTARSSSTNSLTSVTEKPENSVYNYIKQTDASAKARTMYEENSYFESDLINSFAWDTATLFLQEYDNREGTNLTPYSMQNSINTGSPLATGTVLETNKDKICNVYDMADNCYEWTTETCSGSDYPCVARGGSFYNSSYYTSSRSYSVTTGAYFYVSFRPLLYVMQN